MMRSLLFVAVVVLLCAAVHASSEQDKRAEQLFGNLPQGYNQAYAGASQDAIDPFTTYEDMDFSQMDAAQQQQQQLSAFQAPALAQNVVNFEQSPHTADVGASARFAQVHTETEDKAQDKEALQSQIQSAVSAAVGERKAELEADKKPKVSAALSDKKHGIITVHIKLPKAPPAPTLDPKLLKALSQPIVENTTVITTTIRTKSRGGKVPPGSSSSTSVSSSSPSSSSSTTSSSSSSSSSSGPKPAKKSKKSKSKKSKSKKSKKSKKVAPAVISQGSSMLKNLKPSKALKKGRACAQKKRCVKTCNRCTEGCPGNCNSFCSKAFKCLEKQMKPFLSKRQRLINRLRQQLESKEAQIEHEREWMQHAANLIRDLDKKIKNVRSHIAQRQKQIAELRKKLAKVKAQMKGLTDSDGNSDITQFLEAKLQKLLLKSAILEGKVASMNAERAIFQERIKEASSQLKKRYPNAFAN